MATDVYTLGTRLLTVVTDYFTQADVALPARSYVFPTTPAIDDDQITVYLLRLYAGLPGAQTAGAPPPQVTVTTASLRVEIARSIKGVTGDGRGAKLPTAAQMQADAATILTDAQTLLAALIDARARYLLTPVGVSFAVPDVNPIPAEGLKAGIFANVDLPLL